MKKILVTGFSGFVSRYFIEYLEENQIKSEVMGVDIAEMSDMPELNYVVCKFRKIDLLETRSISDIIFQFQPDYILHLASYSSVAFSWKNPSLSFLNNTNIFLNILDAVRSLGIKTRILSVGSSEEYGNINANNLPLQEDLSLDPVSPYAVARVSQEMLSRVYCKGYGMDIILTRSFNHFGPRQRDVFVIPSFAKQIAEIAKSEDKKGSITTGDLSIIRDFTDVRDVVKAYYMILENGVTGEIYNICSGQGVSLNNIVNRFAEISQTKITTITNKDYIRPNDNKIIIGSNEKLRDQIGWFQTYKIDDSLRDIYNYWKSRV